ncbi:MAG: DotA/TraY family protein [Alphaproteobacteria bacterium]|nr:DotA/TraY family protein [Alphaproteobacteria bacterium]
MIRSVTPPRFLRSQTPMACMALAAFLFPASHAMAQAASADTSAASQGDWAAVFIDILFRGGDSASGAPFAGAQLASIAAALHRAMSAYSLSMLVLAGFLLFYHIAAMVAETAHHGVVMGRRGNQVWAPIRLVVAVLLLVPMGGGLSAGQHVVLKIASSGSNMASRAWDEMAAALSGNFFSLVTPRGPDLTSFVAASIDMEMCQNAYERLRAVQASDAGVRLAGDMGDIQKRAATGIAPETWRYTNLLNASSPMCGEYRFSGYRSHSVTRSLYDDGIVRIADDIAAFSHAEADATLAQARNIALYAVPAFADDEQGKAFPIRGNIAALRQSLQKQIDAHMQTLAAAQTSLAGEYLTQANEAGWISSAFFIPDLVRLQESYGELASRMLPDVQEPVFAHRGLTQQVLFDALSAEPALNGGDRALFDNLSRFYAKVASVNTRARKWLYDSQIDDPAFASESGFDLRDQVTYATDASAAFGFLTRAIDTAALSHSVWGDASGAQDQGNPFTLSSLEEVHNPLAVLIEFGRRQFDMGTYLVGMASSIMAMPQILAPALLAAILGALFVLGGLGLVFLVPFLPFVRFLLAVIVWLVELLEALVAIPLVALAHLTPVGEGISGSAARQSYLLWIALALRPILSVFGLAAGALIFALGIFVLFAAFAPLAQLATATSAGILIVANTGFILVFDVLAVIVANAAFKGINRLPDSALRWISLFVMTDSAPQSAPAALDPSSAVAIMEPSSLSASANAIAQFVGFNGKDSGGPKSSGASSSDNKTFQSSLFPVPHRKTDVPPSGQGRGDKETALPARDSAVTSVTVAASFANTENKKKDQSKDPNAPPVEVSTSANKEEGSEDEIQKDESHLQN